MVNFASKFRRTAGGNVTSEAGGGAGAVLCKRRGERVGGAADCAQMLLWRGLFLLARLWGFFVCFLMLLNLCAIFMDCMQLGAS